MCAECTQGDDGLVSLFTREWIEIMVENVGLMGVQCLPLYEGVD